MLLLLLRLLFVFLRDNICIAARIFYYRDLSLVIISGGLLQLPHALFSHPTLLRLHAQSSALICCGFSYVLRGELVICDIIASLLDELFQSSDFVELSCKFIICFLNTLMHFVI